VVMKSLGDNVSGDEDNKISSGLPHYTAEMHNLRSQGTWKFTR
jgi:hypothetical protein